MAKQIINAPILNPYRSKTPRGFYNAIKGHTGLDLKYVNEELPSPVSGEVVGLLKQREMGNVMYLEDKQGSVHVFAHLSQFKKNLHDQVKRGDIIAITGNTGAKTTAPHLHYEILTPKFKVEPLTGRSIGDYLMTRQLYSFKGLNADPLWYLQTLYKYFKITF